MKTSKNFLYVAPAYTVSFDHSTYSVNEGDGQVMLMLVLSHPSLSDVTITVATFDGSATCKNVYTLI